MEWRRSELLYTREKQMSPYILTVAKPKIYDDVHDDGKFFDNDDDDDKYFIRL